MAAFNRLSEATYEVHESVKVDTLDNEDHTFCGIMFPIKCKELLPIDHIAIRSVAVRGHLGPLTVWVSKEKPATTTTTQTTQTTTQPSATIDFRLHKKYWTKVYEAVHSPSPHEYCSLVLDEPITLKPGQVRAIYIHSTLPGDQAIVYDNASYYLPRRGYPFAGHHHHAAAAAGGGDNNNNNNNTRYSDAALQIFTGRAHVSNEAPFGQRPIWGWGNAWRDNREFVGSLEYGMVYKLWDLNVRQEFGPNFQDALLQLKLCQTKWESPMSRLPDECIYYILNLCRWDWFEDTPNTMKEQQQARKLRLQEQQRKEEAEKQRQRAAQQAQKKKSAKATTATSSSSPQEEVAEAGNSNNNNSSNSSMNCCARARAACNTNKSGSGGDLKDNSHTNSTEDISSEDDDVFDDNDDDQEEYVDALEEAHLDDDDDDEDEEDDEDFVVEDELMQDSDDSDEDDSDDDNSDDDSWERANGYRADHNIFRFVDPDIQQEQEGPEAVEQERLSRQAWIQRQFNRIHVLRALAREENNSDVDDDDAAEEDEEAEDSDGNMEMHLVF